MLGHNEHSSMSQYPKDLTIIYVVSICEIDNIDHDGGKKKR